MLRIKNRALGAIAFLVAGHVAVGADELKVGGTGAATGFLERLAAAYSARHPGDTVEVVLGLGSTGAISAVGEAAIDLAISGRPIKEEEKAKGLQSAPLLHTPFIFVTSHPQGQKLTKSDIVAIHDGRLVKWADGKEIRPVLRPKSDSVTPFLHAKFDGMQAAMDKLRQRPDVPVAATDQDNKDMAEKVPNSFAGMTLLQFITEAPRLRGIGIDGVQASVAAMEEGTYKLAMTLYMVGQPNPSPVVRRFISFTYSAEAAKLIRESGGMLTRAD